MFKLPLGYTLIAAAALFASPLAGQDLQGTNVWRGLTSIPENVSRREVRIKPDRFHGFNLDHAALRPLLSRAPHEALQRLAGSPTTISLPMPDGSQARYRFVESPVMAPELAAKFPEIKTYLGQGIDDPRAVVRFDLTPAGFHAQVLSPNGAVYIDPYYLGDTNFYACYYKRDYRRALDDFHCLTAGRDASGTSGLLASGLAAPAMVTLSDGNLRTYRLACAATAEYTAYFGGTVAAGMAAIVTAINRVSGVYESELAIRLVLVANNNLIVYTNPSTEPYSNGNPSLLLSQNQSNLDAVIGSANYDIGHVFGTAGGGLAGVGVVCQDSLKAWGETGMTAPVGDAFYIDYVAHEMGHQFGACHPFNSSAGACGGGNRNAATAFEPGSGSTIMAYAGICGADNLQMHSDPYFHSSSLEAIIAYTTTGAGGGCAVLTSTGNGAPTVSAGAGFTIPKGTPFTLTAAASDPDGNTLTYCWEERDLGPSITLTTPDNGSSPLFRSCPPTTSPGRTFPQLSCVLNNTTSVGEMLPTTTRTMSFRVTARDNFAGGGAVATVDTQVAVNSNAGPFVVTSPTTAVTWSNLETVTWNVAGTAGAPINATNVNILLSTNGGLAFPFLLASNVANSGTQTVLMPNLSSGTCRLRVEAVGNIFFAVSPTNFTVLPTPPVVVLDSTTLASEGFLPANNAIDPGETVTVLFGLKNVGWHDTVNLVATLLATNGVISPSGPQSYGVVVGGGAAVNLPFTFTANGTCGGSITPVLQLKDGTLNLGTVTNTFTLGQLATVFTQNFDSVTAPALPAGWTTATTGAQSNWVTRTSVPDTAPNAAFSTDAANVGLNQLVSPLVALPAGPAQLTFRNNYDLENDTVHPTNGYDGGVLEIQIGTNAFTDILTAGGSFVVGGYNTTISSGYSSPLAGRRAWSGTSGGFITTTVNLPLAAAGRNIQLRWRCGTDNGGASRTGWSIDTVSITGRACGVNTAPVLLAQTNRTINEFTTLVVTNTATDAESPPEVLSYQLLAPPAGATIDTNGIIVWTPTQAQSPSTNLLTTVVSDNAAPSLSATNSFTVVVREVNVAPVLPVTADQTVAELTLLTVTNNATEANIHATLGYTLVNPPAGMSIDTNGIITWTPGQLQSPGTNLVTTLVTNTDPYDLVNPHLSATNTFTVNVREVNVAPVLPVIADQTVAELTLLTVTNTATEANIHATLGYALINPPNGMGIDANGIITWTPSQDQSPGTNTVTTVVTNTNPYDLINPHLSATNSFAVVVREVNAAPVLPAIPDQSVAELTLLTVTNTAANPDVHATLGYTLVNPPGGMSIDTNGIITWTPSQDQSPGTNTITSVVTNTNPYDLINPHLCATNSFTVVVQEVNVAPVLPVIPVQTVDELTLLTVTNTATESNLHATLGYALVNPPGGMSIDTNGIITWTPRQGRSPGTNTITTVVTNTDAYDLVNPHLSGTNSFTLIVREVNVAPVLPVLPDQTVGELTLLTVTNTATESNRHATLGYVLVNPPSGMSIDTNGIITWTPSQAQSPSTNTIATVVTNTDPYDLVNPHLSASNSFTVIVREVNVAPALPVIADQTVDELALLTVTNSATESNLHAILGYALVDPPNGMSIDTNGIITWTPSQAQSPGTNMITTVVTNTDPYDLVNPYLSATNTFTVIVREVNVAPVLPAIPDQTVGELTLLTVTNTASEANIHATLGYVLINPPNGMSIDTNGIITWTPGQAQSPGTNTITTVVTNTDPYDLVNPYLNATNSFTVIVKETFSARGFGPIPDQTVVAGETLVVTNTAIAPMPPATALVFSLATDVPVGAAINPTNGVFTWTPTEAQAPSTNLITVFATDNIVPSSSATQTFTVIVLPTNRPPVLAAVGDRTLYAGTTLLISNSATDPDLPANTLTFSLDPGAPAGMTINATNGSLVWPTSLPDAGTTNQITVRVTDDGVPSLSDTQTFVVTVLSPPAFESLTVSNGVATLTWSAVPGQTYRVEYRQSLQDTNWSELSPDLTASGASAEMSDAVGAAPQRFYRLRLVPTPAPAGRGRRVLNVKF